MGIPLNILHAFRVISSSSGTNKKKKRTLVISKCRGEKAFQVSLKTEKAASTST